VSWVEESDTASVLPIERSLESDGSAGGLPKHPTHGAGASLRQASDPRGFR